jgi:hypothetical protein
VPPWGPDGDGDGSGTYGRAALDGRDEGSSNHDGDQPPGVTGWASRDSGTTAGWLPIRMPHRSQKSLLPES